MLNRFVQLFSKDVSHLQWETRNQRSTQQYIYIYIYIWKHNTLLICYSKWVSKELYIYTILYTYITQQILKHQNKKKKKTKTKTFAILYFAKMEKAPKKRERERNEQGGKRTIKLRDSLLEINLWSKEKNIENKSCQKKDKG